MLNWDDPLATSTTQETAPPPASATAYEESIAKAAVEQTQQVTETIPAYGQSSSPATDSAAPVTKQKAAPAQKPAPKAAVDPQVNDVEPVNADDKRVINALDTTGHQHGAGCS